MEFVSSEFPLYLEAKRSDVVVELFVFRCVGFFWQLFTRLRADYVFIFEVSPMTQALPGVWYAKRRNTLLSLCPGFMA